MEVSRFSYTPKQKAKVIRLFNRTILRPGEKVVDNSDLSISKEVGLTRVVVTNILAAYLDRKFIKLNKQRIELGL